MKIVSDYKDYYDFYANDRNLSDQIYRWERKTAILEPDFSVPKSIYHEIDCSFEIFGFMLCFCGRLIPGLATRDKYDKFCYSYGEFPENVVMPKRPGIFFYKGIKDLFEITHHPWTNIIRTGMSVPRLPILDMHRKLNSPVFACGLDLRFDGSVTVDYRKEEKVVVNPRLKDIGFDKFMDGFQAFQELDRFVSNELAPVDSRVVVIPDKLKAESHGFDKFSFRKDKVS